MIETVVALLMFVGAEIKEHRIQDDAWLHVYAASARPNVSINQNVQPTNALKVKQN